MTKAIQIDLTCDRPSPDDAPQDEVPGPASSRDALLARYRQRISEGFAKKLSRQELDQLAFHFIDRLRSLSNETDIRELCIAEIAILEEGYPQSSIAGQYLPNYRKFLRAAIEDGSLPLTDDNSRIIPWTKIATGEQGETRTHYALIHLKYDATTYTRLRQSSSGANNVRQDNLQIVCLSDYLKQAQSLLQDHDPILQAIGLCALTGRRHTEIVAKGRFSRTKYPYTLHFEGQQKKEFDRPFEILTLIPAQEVMGHLERFRATPKVEELLGLNHDAPAVARFNARVNRAVKQYFQDTDIVPVVEGFKTVSIHRLRGLYGAIAIHYFCPEHRNEHRFLQHYLGHLLDEEGQNQPNAAATQHYFHYRLCNEAGKILTARGIKTMANGLPPVPDNVVTLPSEPFQALAPREFPVESPPHLPADRTLGTDDHHAFPQSSSQPPLFPVHHPNPAPGLMDAFGVDAVLNADPLESPTAYTAPVAASALSPTTPTTDLTQALTNQSHTLAWLTRRLETLEAEIGQLRQERDAAIAAHQPEQHQAELKQLRRERDAAIADRDATPSPAELEQLRQENQRLATELAQATAKLDRFRSLLDGSQSEEPLPDRSPAEPRMKAKTAPKGRSAKADANPSTSPSAKADTANKPTATADAPGLATGPSNPDELAALPGYPSGRTILGRPPRASGGAKARAMAIFLGIQDWNRQHPDNTFAITAGLLEQSFGINRKAAKFFIDDNQAMLWEHHQSIGVSNERGHNRGKDAQELRQFIERLP